MRRSVLEIIKSLIQMNAYTTEIAQAIRVIKKEWPNLTEEEKSEIDAVVSALRSIHNGEDLDKNSMDKTI